MMINDSLDDGSRDGSAAAATQDPPPRAARAIEEFGDVAVFIDWENGHYSLKERGFALSPPLLMKRLRSMGRIVVAQAYADWTHHEFHGVQAKLDRAGFTPVFVSSKWNDGGLVRKNSVDVKMSVDCVELCLAHNHIKTFILVSGDADFLHVASVLRRLGRRVIMIGVSWSTSGKIADRVDAVQFYDGDVDENLRPSEAADRATDLEPATPALDAALAGFVKLVKSRRDSDLYPTLASLGSDMKDAVPGFDHGRLGFKKFSDFAIEAQRKGLVRLARHEMTYWAFLPGETPPWSSTPWTGPAPTSRPAWGPCETRPSLLPPVPTAAPEGFVPRDELVASI